MKTKRSALFVPILLITLGVGWLLTALGIGPGILWTWSLGLAAIGIAALAVYGLDKVTVVLGPFFLAASGLSLLRQTDRLRGDIEIPILVILSGVLLLIARLPAIPHPSWLADPPPR